MEILFFFLPYIISRPWNVLIHIRVIACRWIDFFCSIFGWGWNCERERHSVALAESSADGRTVASLIVSFSIRYTNTRRCASAPFQFSRMNKFDFLHNKKIREKKKYENLFVFFSLNTTATREVDTSRNWRWKPSRASIRFFFFSQCSYRQRSRPRHVTCSFVGHHRRRRKGQFFLFYFLLHAVSSSVTNKSNNKIKKEKSWRSFFFRIIRFYFLAPVRLANCVG